MQRQPIFGILFTVTVGCVAALALAPSASSTPAQADDPVVYVDGDASAGGDGQSWGTAHRNLQDALDQAEEGAEIWVAEGIYTPTQEFSPGDPRSATFQLKNGVALYGGFDPTVGDVSWEDRDWVGNVTILSGDIGAAGNSGDNSYHVFYHPSELGLDGRAVLDGFVVSGGNASSISAAHRFGGGMYNDHASPTVINCTFRGNSADSQGGGMYNNGSSPAVTNCSFVDNSADWYGGGMDNSLSWAVMTNCTFSGNSAFNGGGMFNGNSVPTLTNCTFSGNSAISSGGGMLSSGSRPAVTNCIFWGDSPDEIYSADNGPVVAHSDIQGGYSGEGNIDADPSFVDPSTGDHHLGPGSPCIDAGTNEVVTVDSDLDGNPRIIDGNRDGSAVADMGAYEFLEALLTVVKQGQGLVTGTPGSVHCGSICTAGFLPGTEVTLTAIAETGWTFSDWSGDIESTDNPLLLTMDADKTLTATFAVKTYVITPTVGAGGVITPGTPQTANHGDDITFTIAANTGYHIADVLVDGISQGAISSYTFSNVTDDHTISAVFAVGVPPEITSADHTTFVVGQPESFTVTASGVPTPTIALSGTLPGGVTFTDNGDGTATLSGTPAVDSAGEYPLTLTASNGVAPEATQAFTLTVNAKVYLPMIMRRWPPTTTVKVVPASSRVSVGEHFSISIVIDYATHLGSFEFRVDFDPSVVHVRGAEVGDFLGSTGLHPIPLGPVIDNDIGTLIMGALSMGDGQGPTGTGVLANVSLEAVGAGTLTLNLRDVGIFDTAFDAQAVAVQDGSVIVDVTPIPPPKVRDGARAAVQALH